MSYGDHAMSPATEYQPGQPLTDLALDQRHRVRLPEWDVIRLEIASEPIRPEPEVLAPPPLDDEDWDVERIEIGS